MPRPLSTWCCRWERSVRQSRSPLRRRVVDVRRRPPSIRGSTSELLEKLPTSRDAFYDLALTTPGMFDGSGSQSSQPDRVRQRHQRERLPDQRRQRDQSRSRHLSARSSTSTTTLLTKSASSDSGSKAEYGSFSGATDRRDDQVRQQRVPRQRRASTRCSDRRPAISRASTTISARRGCSLAKANSSRAKPRRTGKAAAPLAVRSARTAVVLRARTTTCAAPACRRAGRCRTNRGTTTPTERCRPCPSRTT